MRWAVVGGLMMGLAGCGAEAGGASHSLCTKTADGHWTDLACTGLYADVTTGTIAADVDAFEPGIALWSDGAEKRRFIRLPPGAQHIDATDMDHWQFPVGTKFWKEFSITVGSEVRRAETRYLEKKADGTWLRTTYAWSEDQTHAIEVTEGKTNLWGTGYEIPAQSACATCHEGAPGGVLGFEAIGLSTPHATGVTMSELVRRGLLVRQGATMQAPLPALTIPGTPAESAAFGWLHANCGNACHNRWSGDQSSSGAFANWTGLFMRLTVDTLGSVQATDTYATAVGQSLVSWSAPDAGFLRVKPGDEAHSALVFRALSRDSAHHTGDQMPPLATRVPDFAGVSSVSNWIHGM